MKRHKEERKCICSTSQTIIIEPASCCEPHKISTGIAYVGYANSGNIYLKVLAVHYLGQDLFDHKHVYSLTKLSDQLVCC